MRVSGCLYAGRMHPGTGPETGTVPGPPGQPIYGIPAAHRRSRPSWLALLAVPLSAAALAVAVISLVRQPDSAMPPPVASPPAATSTAASNTGETDRALCEAIAPLIKESTAETNSFTALGRPGSPERDAGIANFVARTRDWANRTQQVLDAHVNPPRYLTRTLQRYIDDMRLFVASVRPGPGTDADRAVWTDSLVALGGPFEVCSAAGVELW